MKTNTLKLILATVAATGLTLIALTRITSSNLSIVSISVSYLAVASLFAIAALDYRVQPRSYVVR